MNEKISNSKRLTTKQSFGTNQTNLLTNFTQVVHSLVPFFKVNHLEKGLNLKPKK